MNAYAITCHLLECRRKYGITIMKECISNAKPASKDFVPLWQKIVMEQRSLNMVPHTSFFCGGSFYYS